MIADLLFWGVLVAFGSLVYFAIAWTIGQMLRKRRLELERSDREDTAP